MIAPSRPPSMQKRVLFVRETLRDFPTLPHVFENTFSNTWSTTLRWHDDGSIFVITGDIPAMWLRDSAAQVRPYLRLAREDSMVTRMLVGVVKRQVAMVLIDSYANAFNEEANGRCHNKDKTEMGDWIWERKYELDSLCAPLKLAYDLWKETGITDHLDMQFEDAARLIVATIKREQDHEKSPYRFQRFDCPATDTLSHDGKGAPVAVTGLSWSGFRPSDDACQFNYLIPSNMAAVVALTCLSELPSINNKLRNDARTLSSEIREAIEVHGKVQHPSFGTIFAYETDGLGNYNLMDDANVPSLLAAPYLGYCTVDDPVYQATRAFVLSKQNPFYFAGRAASGIGSPHTPTNYIWPISLCIQGLTSTSRDEKLALLKTLLATDAGTGLMHESFHKDDPTQFTRPWFAWANSMFAEFVLDLCDINE